MKTDLWVLGCTKSLYELSGKGNQDIRCLENGCDVICQTSITTNTAYVKEVIAKSIQVFVNGVENRATTSPPVLWDWQIRGTIQSPLEFGRHTGDSICTSKAKAAEV